MGVGLTQPGDDVVRQVLVPRKAGVFWPGGLLNCVLRSRGNSSCANGGQAGGHKTGKRTPPPPTAICSAPSRLTAEEP